MNNYAVTIRDGGTAVRVFEANVSASSQREARNKTLVYILKHDIDIDLALMTFMEVSPGVIPGAPSIT